DDLRAQAIGGRRYAADRSPNQRSGRSEGQWTCRRPRRDRDHRRQVCGPHHPGRVTLDMLPSRSLLAVIAGAVLTEPAFAAAFGSAAPPGVPWLRIVFAFALCIGVAFAAIWLLRLYREGSPRDTGGGARWPRR